ncbi:MAG: hypothetical protein IJ829_05875, partial [Kiritimatiellae bacterium]|nr:hypothetical protein [Kiritimatiellia bacterium]
MNERMKTTLRAWPVVAALTIALCALTKIAAEALGIDLPDQQNVGTLRAILLKAFDSPVDFLVCLYSLALVVAVLPAAEEGIFRFLLF